MRAFGRFDADTCYYTRLSEECTCHTDGIWYVKTTICGMIPFEYKALIRTALMCSSKLLPEMVWNPSLSCIYMILNSLLCSHAGTPIFNPCLLACHTNVVERLSVTCNLVDQLELFHLALWVRFLGIVSRAHFNKAWNKSGKCYSQRDTFLAHCACCALHTQNHPLFFLKRKTKYVGGAISVKTQLARFPFENS